MALNVVQLTQQLVRIPSVNPMGRDVTGPEFYEVGVTNFLENLFAKELAIPFERHQVSPQRDNILAQLHGNRGGPAEGPLILLEVHQDTIPVDGMTIDPFGGSLSDGRIYGRGACDVKGTMACMLAALGRLKLDNPASLPTIVLACTVNEECGFTGATHLVDLWRSGQSRLLPRAPDAVIVAEPTGCEVVVAHKGVLRWRCHTIGKASHSSAPEKGVNAIYNMRRVLAALEQYATQVVPGLGQHPLVGCPTLAVSTIHGGISINTVPDRCTIEIDRRLLPSEDPPEAYRHVEDYLRATVELGETALEMEPVRFIAKGLSDEFNGTLAERIVRIVRPIYAETRKIGVPYGTDAGVYSAAAVPSVVFGAGSIEQAHTADEWVATEQLELAAEAIYHVCMGLF